MLAEPEVAPVADVSGAELADPDVADSRRRRRATRWLIAALVVSGILKKIGEASAPTLLSNAPLLLVAASPDARYLLLASQTVGAVPLILVALTRRMFFQPVVYQLGRLHGRGMLGWFDSRFKRIGRMMRAIERWFGRWPGPVAVAFPGGLTMFLAGDIRMRLAKVLPLTAVGLLLRICFTLWLGEVFSAPLEAVLGFVGDHQGLLTLLTFGLTAWHLIRTRRRTRAASRPRRELLVPPPPPPPRPLDARRLILRSYGPLAALIAALIVLTLVVPDRRAAEQAPGPLRVAESPAAGAPGPP
jgi:membrane protein DedA with SNARE-associated domain